MRRWFHSHWRSFYWLIVFCTILKLSFSLIFKNEPLREMISFANSLLAIFYTSFNTPFSRFCNIEVRAIKTSQMLGFFFLFFFLSFFFNLALKYVVLLISWVTWIRLARMTSYNMYDVTFCFPRQTAVCKPYQCRCCYV